MNQGQIQRTRLLFSTSISSLVCAVLQARTHHIYRTLFMYSPTESLSQPKSRFRTPDKEPFHPLCVCVLESHKIDPNLLIKSVCPSGLMIAHCQSSIAPGRSLSTFDLSPNRELRKLLNIKFPLNTTILINTKGLRGIASSIDLLYVK